MTKSAMTGLRVPQAILDRADRLIPALAQLDSGRASGAPVRSEVLRMALVRGLDQLERECATPASKSAKRR
jgi:hypothetical protein